MERKTKIPHFTMRENLLICEALGNFMEQKKIELDINDFDPVSKEETIDNINMMRLIIRKLAGEN